jgi:hypothetical protein
LKLFVVINNQNLFFHNPPFQQGVSLIVFDELSGNVNGKAHIFYIKFTFFYKMKIIILTS